MEPIGLLAFTQGIIVWSLVLIGVLVVLFLVVMGIRQRVMAPEAPTGGGSGFTVADLRELLKSGQISQEEFDKAKGLMMASMGVKPGGTGPAAAAGPAAPEPPPPGMPPLPGPGEPR